jgi:hypothetical protein
MYQQEQGRTTEPHDAPPLDDDEEEPAFLPSSPVTSRPPTAGKQEPIIQVDTEKSSNRGSDSFSDLSDASISKSALEEALEEHLRHGGSVAASQMQGGGGVRSIWKGKFVG